MRLGRATVLPRVLLGLVLFTLGATPATQSDVPPWEMPAALTPIRLRKAWIPCYHVDQNQPELMLRMHDHFIGELQTQQPAVLFVGDSITGFWRRGANHKSWQDLIAPLNAYNLGVAGDLTENVLWRLQNGELAHIHPKVIVLMIGTNNLWRDSAGDVAKGMDVILDTIHHATPDAKVLLLGILERTDREARPDFESKRTEINKSLHDRADGKRIFYLYFGDKFLDQDGKLAHGFLADGLHPTPRGYQVWAEQIRPVLDDLLK
jgi:lysophospholipase L1-like esterase